MSRIIDLTGEVFGRLTVVSRSINDIRGEAVWECVCECGDRAEIRSSSLRKGLTKSCGCLSKELGSERASTHGHSKEGKVSPTYQSYSSMKKRCCDPLQSSYENYGAKGIDVCQSWLDSFENFLLDMGERPEGMSLDRIDGDRGYSKDNCRWADLSLQAYNQKQASNNTSGRTGVYFREDRTKQWQASIGVKGKLISLGSFIDYEEACNAREQAELEYYGFTKE